MTTLIIHTTDSVGWSVDHYISVAEFDESSISREEFEKKLDLSDQTLIKTYTLEELKKKPFLAGVEDLYPNA